jgi:CheY-like chemotaxis protein
MSEAAAPDLRHRARILLVDDNPNNRELITALLAPFDLQIHTSSDGAEAIAAVEHAGRDAAPFDIILMDIHMPILDGLSATQRIRALEGDTGQRTPIIAMTANVLPDQVATCLAAGMDGHVGKPILPEALLTTLTRWLPAEGPAQPDLVENA